eukprot:4776157-Amphidinium_carterae.2
MPMDQFAINPTTAPPLAALGSWVGLPAEQRLPLERRWLFRFHQVEVSNTDDYPWKHCAKVYQNSSNLRPENGPVSQRCWEDLCYHTLGMVAYEERYFFEEYMVALLLLARRKP